MIDNVAKRNQSIANLEKARLAQIEKREAGEAERLNPLQRAIRHPESLRRALSAKCWECVGGVNAAHEIAHCAAWGCPLWPVRPYRHKAPALYGEKERLAAITRIQNSKPAPETEGAETACFSAPFESN